MATAEFDATGASTPATISFVFIENALIADLLHHRIDLLINQLDLGPEPPIFRRRRFGAQKVWLAERLVCAAGPALCGSESSHAVIVIAI